MKKVFAKKYMVVFQREEHDEFVVYNTKKEWEDGHTHIHSYKQAMYLVDCILNNKIPKKVRRWYKARVSQYTKTLQEVGE